MKCSSLSNSIELSMQWFQIQIENWKWWHQNKHCFFILIQWREAEGIFFVYKIKLYVSVTYRVENKEASLVKIHEEIGIMHENWYLRDNATVCILDATISEQHLFFNKAKYAAFCSLLLLSSTWKGINRKVELLQEDDLCGCYLFQETRKPLLVEMLTVEWKVSSWRKRWRWMDDGEKEKCYYL